MKDLFFIGTIPWWAIVLIALGALAALALQFFSLKQRLSGTRSALLTLLRGVVFALLIFLLLSPALLERKTTKLRRPLALLLDTSQSMGFAANSDSIQGGGKPRSRLDLAKEKLLSGKEPLIQQLGRDYDLRIYQFGNGLAPVGADTLPQLSAKGRGTRLLEALGEASGQIGDRGALLVFSDGIANSDIKSAEDLPSFPVPIFPVGLGETQGFIDIRVADLKVPEFAFRGREIKIDFALEAFGLGGRAIPIYLNRGQNLLSSRNISIDKDTFTQRVTFSYTPKEIGSHSFTLTVPLQPGEQITQNNQQQFKIEVQRDKIRILTLSGAPSWNYRFLRMALKQDPSVDLVSFVFLRTPTDSVDVPDNQLSLIPFPIDELFLEEIKNFDVIFMDDFSYRSYFNTLYLEKVRDFVRDGGGLAMLGGARSFDSGGYGESPLREVVPVEMNGKGTYQTGASLRATLTPPGKAHPITRLLPDPRANEEAWKTMPYLTTLNQVVRGKGETLLMAAPEGASGGTPLLTVGRYGKGRTLALMTNDLWRWNFIAVGGRESPQNHLKLVRQSVRWLAQEPSFEQVQIQPVGDSNAPGEKMDLKVRVLKDDFTPAEHARVRLRIVGPEGEPMNLEALAATEPGDYRTEFIPTREGSYRLEAEAQLSGKPLGKDRRSFRVAFPYGELEDGRPRPELLKAIAEKSQGEFIPASEWNEKSLERISAKLEAQSPSQIVEQRQIQLWSNLWFFSLVLALLCIEWWLRRKWGLV
jgi:uncharacterized membrane protein